MKNAMIPAVFAVCLVASIANAGDPSDHIIGKNEAPVTKSMENSANIEQESMEVLRLVKRASAIAADGDFKSFSIFEEKKKTVFVAADNWEEIAEAFAQDKNLGKYLAFRKVAK